MFSINNLARKALDLVSFLVKSPRLVEDQNYFKKNWAMLCGTCATRPVTSIPSRRSRSIPYHSRLFAMPSTYATTILIPCFCSALHGLRSPKSLLTLSHDSPSDQFRGFPHPWLGLRGRTFSGEVRFRRAPSRFSISSDCAAGQLNKPAAGDLETLRRVARSHLPRRATPVIPRQ